VTAKGLTRARGCGRLTASPARDEGGRFDSQPLTTKAYQRSGFASARFLLQESVPLANPELILVADRQNLKGPGAGGAARGLDGRHVRSSAMRQCSTPTAATPNKVPGNVPPTRCAAGRLWF
jgi:hypothetical protein